MLTQLGNYMGLTNGSADTRASEKSQPRHDVYLRRRLTVFSLWVIVAVAIYVMLNLRMPADDGLGGFAPLFIAVLTGALGSSWSKETPSLKGPRR